MIHQLFRTALIGYGSASLFAGVTFITGVGEPTIWWYIITFVVGGGLGIGYISTKPNEKSIPD